MAKKKPAKAANDVQSETQPDAAQAADPSSGMDSSAEAADVPKRKWLSRSGGWGDYEAGVHLIEDRKNRRMTIKFEEKPSEAVREVMKKEYGYRFDGEEQLWYKRINLDKPRQSRGEAEELAFKVDDMIREEMGLAPRQPFNLGT